MKHWTPQQVAEAAGARLIAPALHATGPERATIDSRDAGAGALFVGLKGGHRDGGRFAPQALAAGAWGVLTTPEHAQAAQLDDSGTRREREAGCRELDDSRAAGSSEAGPRAGGIPEHTPKAPHGVLLAAEDPLKALQSLATAWRRELEAAVIGVTGSTGKTSTKDLLGALLSRDRHTVASRANFNTEIGLPLEILAAPAGTEVLVLEMGMRGAGQIAELAAIAQPDVALIVSVGPVHLELLGTVEAVAAAKAELIASLRPGGTAITPAGERLLEPHLRADVHNVSFGPGGDVRLIGETPTAVVIDAHGERIELQVPFTQAHLRANLLAAVAAARAVGVTPGGHVAVSFSAGRGQRTELPGGVVIIDDCYNANPMSMRAALDDLAATASVRDGARTVAVLGDMLELGPEERRYHVEIGAHAAATGVGLLVTVGPLAEAIGDGYGGQTQAVANATQAAALVPDLLRGGDVVLVKASRGVGLELVCGALLEGTRA